MGADPVVILGLDAVALRDRLATGALKAANLAEALKATDQLTRNRNAGIVDMFGSSAGGDDALHIDLPECEEWPLKQKLEGERETLGHYLSGHPLDPYREELQALVGTDLGQLDSLWAARDQKGGTNKVVAVIGDGSGSSDDSSDSADDSAEKEEPKAEEKSEEKPAEEAPKAEAKKADEAPEAEKSN